MSNYRRVRVPGGTYFFTVVTHQRRPVFDNENAVSRLREALSYVRKRRSFELSAIVVLPDHLHCIWSLPDGDADYAARWQMLKTRVTRSLRRKPLWQPRFWEHWIRDDEDYRRHADYIHYNPVKHGYVNRPSLWRWSSFHREVRRGRYSESWGACEPESIAGLDFE